MFSIISSRCASLRAATFSNSYRFTTTISIVGMLCSASAAMWSGFDRIASTPPATRGWIVFTLPSSISGTPVRSATSCTASPASFNARAVPPVETSSTPSATSPRAKSAIPVLSVTLKRARLICGMKLLFSHDRYNESVPHRVTIIPGDGIGPEVAESAMRAINATGVDIQWERKELTADIIIQAGKELPSHVLDSLNDTRVGLKGPIATPVAGGFKSVNVALRKKLDLFANVRPIKTLPGLKTRYNDVAIDMVIFRENTEDLYSGLEHEVVTDVVESLKIITRFASMRIAHYAFNYAAKHGRKKVTAVHKANIMKLSDGLFLRCCREVAAMHPEIGYSELIVDNASMQLVMRPEQFDILLLPNLYGDIGSDL